MQLEIRLLGRFSVRREGQELPPAAFGGRLVRTLLRILVSRRGSFVTRDVLIEALWPAGAPGDPAGNLHVMINRARRALGEPTLILTGEGGYSFAADDRCVVDAESFMSQVATGRRELTAGRPVSALREFEAALAVWGGEALEEEAYEDWAQEYRRTLARAYLEALEGGATAALAAGQPGRAVALAERAVMREPVREVAHLHLVRALGRNGDTVAALDVLRRFRRRVGEELGLDLSNEAEELETRLLRGEPIVDELPAPLAFPPDLAGVESRPFVGRANALELAQRFFADDTRDRLGVLWILGEPGIGKTRLAREIARRVHADGAIVLFGRCTEDLRVPYQPLLEALGWHVAHLPDAELADRLGTGAGELTRLAPEIALRLGVEPARSTIAEIEEHRLFDAVRLWLAAAGGGRPLVVVLDDVHWATGPTLALLGHVARSAEPSRTLLVCTARDTLPDANAALAALAEDLDRQGVPSNRLELRGLDLDGVGELVRAAAGRASDDRLRTIADQLYEGTAGNPLLVDAVLAGLSFDPASLVWAPGELPGSLADSVLRRVNRLPALVELLQTAAVAGLDFDLRVVARAVGRAPGSVLDALESAARAGLVEETGVNRHRFSHALVRSVLREALSRSRRAVVHLRVGEGLEAVYEGHLDEHVGALAYHFCEAAPVGGAMKAYRYTVLDAERATRLLAHQEAADAYGRALTLLERLDHVEPLARYELLLAKGAAQRRTGDLPGALDTLRAAAEEAAARLAPEPLAQASVAAEETSFWLGLPDDGVVALLSRAEEALPAAESRLRALTEAGLSRALQFSGRWPESIRRGNQALAIAERLDDPATTLAVLSRANVPYFGVADSPRAAARWLEVASRAEALGDDEARAQGLAMALWATAQIGDLPGFDRLLATYLRLTGELRQPTWALFLDLLRSFRAFVAGDLEAAERFLQCAEDLGERLGWARQGLYGVAMFLIRREQGRLADLMPAIRLLVQLSPPAAFWRFGLGAIYADLGMLDEARSEFEALTSMGFADLPPDANPELCLALLTEVCVALKDSERAAELIDLLRPCEGRLLVFVLSAACLGPADRLLAMLATTAHRPEDAERWNRRSLELARRFDSPLWEAHCLYDHAVSLCSTEPRRARAMLAEAAILCERHGLTSLAGRVADLRCEG